MEREEENFLFSVVGVTSLKKRERERQRSKSRVRLTVCSSTLAATVTSRQEKQVLRSSLVSSTVTCVCCHRTEWIEGL